MKKTKGKRIAAGLLGGALLIGLLLFANAFVGNPISHFLASRHADAHLAEHYGETDYTIDSVNYSFKDGSYWAKIFSPSSQDTHFTLLYDALGHLQFDSFENDVLSRNNTAQRLDGEYRDRCHAILNSPSFPEKLSIGYGTLIFSSSDAGEPGAVPESFPIQELELDQHYDLAPLAAQHGVLVLSLETADVSPEHAAQVLLATRRQMEAANFPFFSMDLTLNAPRDPEGTRTAPSLSLMNFAWDDIQEEGLSQRVAESIAATKDYYQRMDALK